jgi:hypothetical protein
MIPSRAARLFSIFVAPLSLLAIGVSSQSAYAESVRISDRRCVASGVGQVHEAITDYGSYARLPGAELSVAGIRLLKMTKSQSIDRIKLGTDGDRTDSLLLVEMRPLNLTDGRLYPRILLRCQSDSSAASALEHHCRPATAGDLSEYRRGGSVPAPFGLASFRSSLKADAASSDCGSGQTLLDYSVDIETAPQDVERIKSALLMPFFPLPEQQFFKTYYENFYSSWVRSLEASAKAR